jgi:hypothetical protein
MFAAQYLGKGKAGQVLVDQSCGRKPSGLGYYICVHGLRLSDQTKVETAVTNTATAVMAGGSSINMGVSDSFEPPLFTLCSMWDSGESARR